MQRSPGTGTIRLFMLFEGAGYGVASLIHSGALIAGYAHPMARVAEGVIAGVLLAGLALSFVRREWTRGLGLAAQGFALAGTLVGLFTIAIGVGPRTVPDLVFHAGIIAVVLSGLAFTMRAGARAAAKLPVADVLRS